MESKKNAKDALGGYWGIEGNVNEKKRKEYVKTSTIVKLDNGSV